MFRHRSSQAFVVFALCSLLAANNSLVRRAHAENTSVVDLEGDTHHDPPASTTDKSTPGPNTATKSDNATAKAITRDQDAAKQQADAENLKRRGGERVGATAVGKAHVFGMSLQEGTHSRVKVVEVTLNSPAYDAGVMKGDEIVAFQGFRGESYRAWIDGIHRLATDTGAGLKIPVIISRDSKQLTVQIEVQPKPALRPAGRALAQPGSPLIPPGVGPALPNAGSEPAPAVVGGNGGNNVVVNDVGTFGDSVGSQSASPNERAVAQIVRIGGQPSPSPSGTTTGASNGSGSEKAQAPTQNPAVGAAATPTKGGARIGMAGFRDDPAGMVVMVDVGALTPGNYSVGIADPSVVGGATVTGTAAVDPNAQAPSQVAPPQPPAGEGKNANSSNSTPTGQSSTNSAQPAQTAKDTTGAGQKSAGVGGTLNQIGTITVDQNGTGRMQQKVESAQVRNVVGQAIVLYSQNAPLQSGSAGPAATQTAASQPVNTGPQVPVAAGIIQLITDRRPPANTAPQTTQIPATANGSDQQPASAAAPAGQSLVR